MGLSLREPREPHPRGGRDFADSPVAPPDSFVDRLIRNGQIGAGLSPGVGPGVPIWADDGNRDMSFTVPLSKPDALPGPSLALQVTRGHRADGTTGMKYTVQAGWDVLPYGLVHIGTYVTIDPERPWSSGGGVQGRAFVLNGQLELTNGESLRKYLYNGYTESLRALRVPAW